MDHLSDGQLLAAWTGGEAGALDCLSDLFQIDLRDGAKISIDERGVSVSLPF